MENFIRNNGSKNNFFCAIVIWKLHITLIVLTRLLFTLKHASNVAHKTWLTRRLHNVSQLNVGIGYELCESSHRLETQFNGLWGNSLYKLTVTNNAQKQNKKLQPSKVKLKVQLRINNNNHKSQKKNFVSKTLSFYWVEGKLNRLCGNCFALLWRAGFST